MAEEIQNTDQKSSYRSIFKATSLFGGVQVYQILIQVIKSKFIAILLGPSGVGIQSLYTTAIETIRSLSSLGLSQSAVRDISEANGTGNSKRISEVVVVLRRLVWITGLVGTILVAILSPLLSKLSFGNYEYTISFILLSTTLLIDQICAGQRVLLQGTRRLRQLAKASAYGSTFGLIISVPMYYLFGVKGIVPTLILNSITLLILTWYFSKSIFVEKITMSVKATLTQGKTMMKLGLAMSVGGILSALSSYALRGIIRYDGGTEEVGLYAAGFAIISTYVGTVFNAITTDYYPRLSSVNKDSSEMARITNQQAEIGVLIIGPLLCLCVILMPHIINLLYSNRFLAANNYIQFATVGMIFRLVSVLMAFQLIARGLSGTYILNELIACIYICVLNILGYFFGGLFGLGLSFTVGYFLYFIQMAYITHKKFSYKMSKNLMTITVLEVLGVSFCIVCCLFLEGWSYYIVGLTLSMSILFFSISELNKKIQVLEIIKSKFYGYRHSR